MADQELAKPPIHNRIVNKLRALRDHHLLGVPPRAADPYVTHLPVLVGVGSLLKIRSVLEFGSGNHSSLTFLDRNCFPDVERVDSFENDVEWGCSIRAKTAHDPRFTMHLLEGSVADAVRTVKIEDYDLIFIDDSVESEQRQATITAVVALRPSRAVVVVHDFEHPPYRHRLRPMKHTVRMTALNPNTGVGWNDAPLTQNSLRALNRLVREQAGSLPLNDKARLATVVRQGIRHAS
ncbi:MAG: hypothetical protein K1X78_12255 [Verrucomicrobiaceae bacterium]|nr:hypothetical protein [Verrucomicrobiaceae bacterium]